MAVMVIIEDIWLLLSLGMRCVCLIKVKVGEDTGPAKDEEAG